MNGVEAARPGPEAWDCHVHVFGDPARFPMAAARRYTPVEAGLPALRAHLGAMGATRVVLVQPTVYGDDHRCLFDALDALGPAAVAVAACPARPAALPAHPRLRGLRVDLRAHRPGEAAAALQRAAAIAAGLGCHLEAQVGPAALAPIGEVAATLGVPLVLDHLAGLTGGNLDAGAAALDRLLAQPGVFVKLSAPERAAGGLAATIPVAQYVANRTPGRLLWGSDWPHTPFHPPAQARTHPLPFRQVDDPALLAALEAALGAGEMASARGGAPARLYGRAPSPPV